MKKYIVIKHSILRNISDEEVKSILSSDAELLKIFEVQPEVSTQHNISDIAFDNAALLQQEYVSAEVVPFLQKNPDATVLYFGAAPIPLAVHLGYALGNWNMHEVQLLHHSSQNWEWPIDAIETSDHLDTFKKFVIDEIEGDGNVVFRVATSYELQQQETNDGLNDIVKQIELKLNALNKDAFSKSIQTRLFADDFEEGLESVMNKFPGAETVHLFAAVPVGLAYLMGTRIRSNLNKRIALYQYNANRNPKYTRVLTLSQAQVAQEPIKGALRKSINIIRSSFSEEVNNQLAAFVKEKADANSKATGSLTWFESCLQKGSYTSYDVEYWKSLPALFNTILKTSSVDKEKTEVGGGFSISEGPPSIWSIDDRFIYWLYKRFNKDSRKIQRALRLFLFHEAVHFHHRLTAYTANEAGGFPRILEEVDYQADVWAMLHEYSFSKIYYPKEVQNEKQFFRELIDVATETMWAFDDAGNPIQDEIQVRRMNRFLIWYWQSLRIEEVTCEKLGDIIHILSHKPLLEVNGLTIKTNGRRVLFDLMNYRASSIEIGALINNKIHRRGATANINPARLVAAFVGRSGDAILEALKPFYKEINPI